MKTLVTGGAGFIGSRLVDKLVDRGHQVVIIDNLSTGRKENLNPKACFYKIDIQNASLSEIFQKEKPETIFHFAAQVDVRKSVEEPIEDAKINILGTLNILENARKYRVKKIIFASSGGAIYGDTNIIPTPEDHLPRPRSPYGITKLAIEHYLNFYKKTHLLDFVSLRFANVYGPRQNSKGEAGVIAIFTDRILRDLSPTIYGNGQQTRDFVYVGDVVQAAIKVFNSSIKKDPIYNIATAKETSINQVHQLLCRLTRKNISANYAPAKSGEQRRSCLDFSKAKKELGWQPKYNLEKGLKETINWFVSH